MTPPGYREGPLTVGSLFAGIGGLELGLEWTGGFKTVWQVEIDANANAVRRRHWHDVPAYPDVKEFTLATDPIRPDLICGGFPCQDLSVAGKRAGLAGERSGLFHEFMRIVAERHPRWVLVENVPGLLSSNKGRDMGTVLGTLAELGYGTAYRILDAQWLGVAQRRRRVFIVGCLGDWRRAAQVLFESESLPWDSPPSREAGARVAGSLSASAGGGGLGGCGQSRSAIAYQCHGSNVGPMGTIRKGNGNAGGGVPFTAHATAVRRLTPTECERLQGFPDGWTALAEDGKPMSDSARYRMLGNAVCVPVARWIGQRILTLEARNETP